MGQAKNRGNYAERVAQATMPSFIVRLNVDKDINMTYDKNGLTAKQIDFADNCITQLQVDARVKIKDPAKAYGYVYWGKSNDFMATVFESNTDEDLDEVWLEQKDMFIATYYSSTNQPIAISTNHCKEVIKHTQPVSIGAKLEDVPTHKYSNFSIAVAWAWQNSQFAKNSIGDLAPPEIDPSSSLYKANFIECVSQALTNLGVNAILDWKPGAMHTKFVEQVQ